MNCNRHGVAHIYTLIRSQAEDDDDDEEDAAATTEVKKKSIYT